MDAMLRGALAALMVGSALLTAMAGETAGPPIPLGRGVVARNVEEPFDYFVNSWALVGLKDHPSGTRITPKGELLLADGLLCRPLVGAPLAPLSWRLKKTLRDGALPIVRLDFVLRNGVRYTLDTLACPLEAEWQAAYEWPKSDSFLTLLRVTLANQGEEPAEAAFALAWQPRKGAVQAEVQDGPAPAQRWVTAGRARLALLELPEGARMDQAAARQEVALRLAPGATARIVVRVPFRPVPVSAEAEGLVAAGDFATWAERTAAFWDALLQRGTRIDVPEAKPRDTYRASIVGQFITRDRGAVHPGEGFYDHLYLRDGAYQAISLAHAGYLAECRQSLEHFLRFQDKSGFFCTQRGQLDGHGYAVWALVEYHRLSGDAEWLRRVYPQVRKAAAWIRQARRRETDPDSPFHGVLPAAPADGENLWDGKHHIVGYDWWSLRGLQAAALAARALGQDEDAAAFQAEFQDYRRCILQAVDRAGLGYIPPSYEGAGTHWGNLEAVFPTPLIPPGDKRLGATLDFVRNRFGAVDGQGGGFIEGTIQWSPPRRGAIHPYMSQFVSNSHIVRGEQAEAVDGLYSFLLHTTSTHGFPEGVYWRRRQAWNNTLPHQWAAALYVITLRNLLLREEGEELHLLSAVPAHWLDAGKRVAVDRAPTHFGRVSFAVEAEAEQFRVRLSRPDRRLPRAVVLHAPLGIELVAAEAEGKALAVGEGRAATLPAELLGDGCTVMLRIRRTGGDEPLTFAAKVAAFQESRAGLFKAIPGLVPPPAEVDAARCAKLDLRRFANTNPLTAPFNVPDPGKYRFTALPLGDQVVGGVPFHILDPAANAGKGLVVLQGARACAEFPREVEVPVGAQGRVLCVLGNVTGWAASDPGVGTWGAVGEYEIRYADGSKQTVPLVTGRTVDDWAQAPCATDVAVGLQRGLWHLNLLAVALEPKPVRSLVLRDLGTPASPVVAAVTVVR